MANKILDSAFLGNGDDIKPIEKRFWMAPVITGIVIISAYIFYEIVKLWMKSTTEYTMFFNYTAEALLLFIYDITAIVMGISMVIIVATCLMVTMETGKPLLIILIGLSICLIISASFAMARVVVDMTVLSPTPMDAWLYRFYNGTTVVYEIGVVLDLMMNLVQVIGIVLIAFSVINIAGKSRKFLNVMERGDRSSNETIDLYDTKAILSCKEMDGVKACKIKE